VITSCTYNTAQCADNDISTKFNTQYGNCFIFNANGTYDSTRAGPLYGLRLLIQTHQPDYMAYIPDAGVRVAVHSNTTEPFIDVAGFNAAPGFATSFGIKYLEFNRLSGVYGDCIDKTDSKGDYYYEGDYVTEGCYRSCIQNAIIDKVGCFDPRLGTSNLKKGTKSCSAYPNDLSTPADKSAMYDKIDAITKTLDIFSCGCNENCIEGSYSVAVSTALWPSEVYTPPGCNNQTLTLRYWKHIDDCLVWYQQNTLLVEAYYERMNYQVISEVADYDTTAFISDAGGQLGLWLGMSFISVVECGAFMVLMCMHCKSGEELVVPVEEPSSGEDSDQPSDAENDKDGVYAAAQGDAEPPKIAG